MTAFVTSQNGKCTSHKIDVIYPQKVALLTNLVSGHQCCFLEAYPEPSQTSKMELFAKIVNCSNPLDIVTKSFTLDD